MTGVPRKTCLLRHQHSWVSLGRPVYSGTNTPGCSDLSTLASAFLGGGTRPCRHQSSKNSQGILLEWCVLCWGATEPELKEGFILCKIWQQGYTYDSKVTLASPFGKFLGTHKETTKLLTRTYQSLSPLLPSPWPQISIGELQLDGEKPR